MDLSKFLEECSSLCMDNKEDRATLNEHFERYINRGIEGIHTLKKEDKITDDELDAAMYLIFFVLRFANQMNLPTLLRWAESEYTTLEGIRRNRNLEWPQGDVPSKVSQTDEQ